MVLVQLSICLASFVQFPHFDLAQRVQLNDAGFAITLSQAAIRSRSWPSSVLATSNLLFVLW